MTVISQLGLTKKELSAQNLNHIPQQSNILMGSPTVLTLRTFSTNMGGVRANEEAGHHNICVYSRKKWQPTPVFLAAESHGQRRLVDHIHGAAKSWTRLSNYEHSLVE